MYKDKETGKETETELVNKIAKCTEKLVRLEPHIDISEVASNLYNKVLIEKAVCKKKLDEYKETFFRRLLKYVKTANPSSKEIICDYFR